MKEVEVVGEIDSKGKLVVLETFPLPAQGSRQVKVVVSYPNEADTTEDLDDTPVAEVKASLKRALQEAREGKTMSLEQMWSEVDKS